MLLKLPVSPALPVVPGPPKQLKSPPAIPVWLVQSVQLIALSAQSATHSQTFPTMSNTPQLDLQFDREPVFTGLPAVEMLQSVVPLSVPGSGVPAAARCHSSFRASRFPDVAHACTAWNHVVQVLGSTPGIDTAYTPGEGGSEPRTGVHWPPAGKFTGKSGAHEGDGESCVAPPPVRSASVASPF